MVQNELDSLVENLAESGTRMSRNYDSAISVRDRLYYARKNLWQEVIGHAVNTVQFVQEKEGD